MNFITYFIIGIPLYWALGFKKTNSEFLSEHVSGIYGLVFGLTFAIILNCTGFLLIVYGPGSVKRWKQVISNSSHRMNKVEYQALVANE